MKLTECNLCSFHKTRTQVVKPIITSNNPSVLFIGDFPTQQDEKHGVPFYNGGKNTPGYWHDKIIQTLEVDSSYAAINTIQCFPGNQQIQETNMEKCSVWVNYLINRFSFRLVVLYGEYSMRLILGFNEPHKLYVGRFFISEKMNGLKCFITFNLKDIINDKNKLNKIKKHTNLIKTYLYR